MQMEPHALIMGGKVKFYNFTHYNTDDLVRILDWAINTGEYAPIYEREDLHVSYASRPAVIGMARLCGTRWRNNGIRVSRPSALVSNPLESLAWDGQSAPEEFTSSLFEVSSRLVSRIHGWGYVAFPDELRDFRIRIGKKVNAKMPKGYMSPHYAKQRVEGAVRALSYRMRRAERYVSRARSHLITLERMSRTVGADNSLALDLSTELRRAQAHLEGLTERVHHISAHIHTVVGRNV